MKRPPVILTAIFCLGILFASKIKIPFSWAYSLALIFLFLGAISRGKGLSFNIILLCLVFLLGVAVFRNSQVLPKCHIYRYAYYKNNNLYTLRGFVDGECLIKNNRTSFVFGPYAIQMGNLKYHCCGNVLVYLKGERDFLYGDELILTGNLYRPYNFSGSKRQGYRDYLYRQGIFSIMPAKTVRVLPKTRGWTLKRFALWSKGKMENLLFKYTTPLAASILNAMILGEKRDIPAVVYNSMIKSGTVHILPRLYTKMPSVAL